MLAPVTVEVIGLKDSSCSPFPCDDTRSCCLYDCYPTGKLVPAFAALKSALHEHYRDRVEVTLTLIDEEVPHHVREIISTFCPPIPIILVNGRLTPVGRISLAKIRVEIEKCL